MRGSRSLAVASLRKSTNAIFIHHTGSAHDESVPDIRRRQRALGYLDIGYHFVIRPDGLTETGRHVDEIGLHAEGHNKTSIGICLVGNSSFTPAQHVAARALVTRLLVSYPDACVIDRNNFIFEKETESNEPV